MLGSLGSPLTSRCLLFVVADDESDSDAEEEQTTVRAVSSHECATQPHWGLLVGSAVLPRSRRKTLERKCCWGAGSWIVEAPGPRQQSLACREKEGGDSYHWCLSALIFHLSRNAGDPHWEFSWMTNARRC